ncbi:polysaccharide lyase beta-sandwich domain-containing protein, partial [Bacteroidales bacterium]|nr:polysaccharide lyase beta-sandwich domain-containing protein [Bacteroidales bacterium]
NLESTSDKVHINEKAIHDFPFSENISDNLSLIDLKGYGYYIPASNDAVEIRKQNQTNGDSFGEEHSGDFALAWINHGKQPKDAQYEYMIQLNSKAVDTNYTVLKKDQFAHVVQDKKTGIVAYAVFKACNDLPGLVTSCSRPGLIMLKQEENKLLMSFCDPDLMTNPGGEITRYNLNDAPTSPKREVEIKLDGEYNSDDNNLTISEGKTKLAFSTHNALIENFEFKVEN